MRILSLQAFLAVFLASITYANELSGQGIMDRKVSVEFIPQGRSTKIVETFEAETTNPLELQRGGWQAILDNFKSYTETL